jgi:tetratricopeptide (TPR) repeat protein
MFEHRPGAAVERPALSAEGHYLAFHTLAAPQGAGRAEDGESLFLVDLSSASVLWQQPVPVVWPSRITFDERSHQVVVHSEDNDIFRYTYEGNFLDEEVVERVELRRAAANEYGYQLFDLALSRLGENPSGQSNDRVAEAEELIRKALTQNMSANTKARAHRVLGEIAEARGDVAAAVVEYSAALKLNPKIGLKKKVQALSGRRDKT